MAKALTGAGRARPRIVARARMLRGLRSFVAVLRGERFLVVGLVLVGLASHGVNLFHYPAPGRFDDEGIYMAQAWSVLRQGRLSPYTYFYDHAPAGWFLIAGWLGLTGGPDTFGSAIDSGRVLMTLLHGASVALLYQVARKLGGNVPAAALTAIIFTLSPLAILYQRPVLLDNIMIFWILLSLVLLLRSAGRLSWLVFSGLSFGLATLSKETALFLLPALLFLVLVTRREAQGGFAFGGWLVPMLIVVSWYPLFALLKEELLGAGQSFLFFLRGGGGSGVSLVDTLRWQASRGGEGMFNLDNQFWQLVRTDWWQGDPLLLLGGTFAAIVNLIRGLAPRGEPNRQAFAAGLLGALPLLFLGRGGIVFDFYILFALPFLALNIGVALAPLLERLLLSRSLLRLETRLDAAAGASRRQRPQIGRMARTAATIGLGAALLGGYVGADASQPLYRARPDQPSRAAVAWLRTNVPSQCLIIGRDALWTDLHEPDERGRTLPGYHSHWKVASDPAVRDGIFAGDWRTVDYVIMSPLQEQEFGDTGNAVALEAYRNAHLVRRWETDGTWIEVWKVDKAGATEAALLQAGAASIGRRFERDGAFIDASGVVTSEAQSYALLRAAWSDDRDGFARAWSWTTANLLDANGLLAWKWQGGAVSDPNTATDADVDTALALLLAGQRWNDQGLREAGTRMVRAIWAREVALVGDRPYITAGNWATQGPTLALNPSYFAPYAYTIFKEVDPEHDWYGVIDTGYRVLTDSANAPLGAARAAGLPPDWVGLDRQAGTLVRATLPTLPDDTTRYGYDAPRAYWRVALHRRWNNDGRAEAFLRSAGFLRDEVARPDKGYASAVYSHDGSAILAETPHPVGTAGALAALLTFDPTGAQRLFASQFIGGAARDGDDVSWGDPNDLYAQEWAWFGIALYADRLPNLWTKPTAP